MAALSEEHCDVLIVGGGPAGLSVAASLPSHLKTILVHQDREIGLPVRTSGGTWVADLQRLGVPPDLYRQMDEITFRSDHHATTFALTRHKMAVLDITGLYQWIAKAARGNGADLRLGCKLLGIEEVRGDYLCTVRNADRSETRIVARYIVEASGGAMAALTALGLAEKPARRGVGIEYEYDHLEGHFNRATLLVGQAALTGYGWVFPTPDNKVRVGVGVIHPETDVSPKDLIDALVTPNFFADLGIKVGARHEVNAGVIPSEPYEARLVYGHVVRVGDAANCATPTVGEGIRIAMDQGRDLGVALGQAICKTSQRPLHKYEGRWKRSLAWNYHYGFLANKRMAQYRPRDWDDAVRRLKHLSEADMAALIRSEYSVKLVGRGLLKLLKLKASRAFGRLFLRR